MRHCIAFVVVIVVLLPHDFRVRELRVIAMGDSLCLAFELFFVEPAGELSIL